MYATNNIQITASTTVAHFLEKRQCVNTVGTVKPCNWSKTQTTTSTTGTAATLTAIAAATTTTAATTMSTTMAAVAATTWQSQPDAGRLEFA